MGQFICKPNYVVQYKPAQAYSAAKLIIGCELLVYKE